MRNALELVEEAIPLLGELENHDDYFGIDSAYEQLTKIRQELIAGPPTPKGIRRSGLSRLVVDSWPMNSSAGERVIEAEHAYMALP